MPIPSATSPKGKSDANDSAFSQKRLEEFFQKYKGTRIAR